MFCKRQPFLGRYNMKYGEFMASLRQMGMKHVFLLAGEEPYFINKVEKRLLTVLFPEAQEKEEGLQRVEDNISPGALMALLDEVPFFSEKNVFLVRDAAFLKEKKGSRNDSGEKSDSKKDKDVEGLISVLENMPESNYVIFELSVKADKRRKIYKAIEKIGAILEAEPVEPWKVSDWLREKLMEIDRRFDGGAMDCFLGAVAMMRPVPLEFLDSEIDKLALYSDKKIFTRRDLETMLSALPEVSGFAMIEAINNHNTKLALTLLERQINDGVYVPVLVALLAKNVRQLMLARSFMAQGIKGKQLAGPLGDGKPINPFIAEKIGRAAATFDEKKLKAIFLELSDEDYLFKIGKSGTERLEHIVIELCRR